jgi:SnoaL-like polyketide cyclase.
MRKRVLLDFINAINRADVEVLYRLMPDDFLFIDAHDNHVVGRDDMRQSWTDYFAMFPDYKIEINETLEKDSLTCILGYASGTYKGLRDESNSNYWKLPAAWCAVVENGKVKHWQVYADNIIVMDIINKNNTK